jgi:diguanylate cyclase (GGDEF)-like protein/PAS domain S-box-containing protein
VPKKLEPGSSPPVAVIECAADLTVIAASESVSHVFGWDPGELPGRHLLDWLAESKAVPHGDFAPSPTNVGALVSARSSIRHRDGGRRSVDIEADWAPSPPGTSPRLTVRLIDVTETGDDYRMLAENSTDVVLHTRSGRVEWASPSLTRVLGWDRDDWTGRRLAEYLHPEDLAAQRRARARIGAGEVVHTRTRVRAKAGTYHWVDVSAGPCRMPDGTLDGIISSGRLADQAVELESELRRLADHDDLTGLLKQAPILARLEASAGGIRPAGMHCGVLFIDVDGLKAVNDRLGHSAGDELLRCVTGRIASVLRPQDAAGRLGGDEFLLVVDGVADLGTVSDLAAQILRAVRESIHVGGVDLRASVSIGATLIGPGEAAQSVVRRADRLMYAAKRLGGNRVFAQRDLSP